jgi:hypothetical protein
MLLRRLFVSTILLSAASLTHGQAPLDVNIAGRWYGRHAVTDHCDNGTTFSSLGTATAEINQNGTSVFGSVTLLNVTLSRGGHDCASLNEPATITITLTGTVTGNSFEGVFDVMGVDGGHPISGTIGATFLTFSFPRDPTTSGTFTLVTGSPPDPDITSIWNGHYAVTDHCDNGTTFSSTGAATARFNQIGSAVFGSVTLRDVTLSRGGRDCASLNESATITIVVTGTVTGSSFAGLFEGEHPISGSVGATAMMLSFPPDPTTSGTFTLSRASARRRAVRH